MALSDQELLLGSLRELRAAAQFLQGSLASLASAVGTGPAAARRAALAEVSLVAREQLTDGTAKGALVLATVRKAIEESTYLRDWLGDEVLRITLVWDQAAFALGLLDGLISSPPATLDLDQVGPAIRAAADPLQTVALAAAQATALPRLNQFLSGMTVGRTITFDSVFSDELPRAADRAELLRRIAEVPAAVNGVVDLATGTIVAISADRGRRRQSYLLETVALVLGGVVAFLSGAFAGGLIVLDGTGIRVPTDSAEGLSKLLTALVVFAAGAGFHFAVDLVKVQQGSIGAPNWVAVGDWLTWLHARELKVVGSIVSLWLVFLGLLFFDPAGSRDPGTAFFAGFAFDSLADVVIKRFDRLSSNQLAALTSELTDSGSRPAA
jgi:hypothetical protein